MIKDETTAGDIADVSRTFIAERYGGKGIAENGGGARCGYDGAVQIKGIGPNPLVGEGVGAAHSDGAMSVRDGLYEALWSEIMETVLPFGCVGIIGVLGTGLDCVDHISGERRRRGLLIRQPCIRPAHFQRALTFRPCGSFADMTGTDAIRVRTAISKLATRLPRPEGVTDAAWRDLSFSGACRVGLEELARRLAIQMAVCQSRFLKSGTSPSNVSMDGRLLDFTSLTSVHPSDVRAGDGSASKYDLMWSEHMFLLEGLLEIAFHVGKAAQKQAFQEMPPPDLIMVRFLRTFELSLCREFLFLCGFPAFVVDACQGPEMFDLGRIVIAIFQRYATGIAMTGGNRLLLGADDSLFGEIVLRLLAGDDAGRSSIMDDFMFGHHLRRDLITAFDRAFQAVHPVFADGRTNRSSLARAMLINVTRASRSRSFLRKAVMMETIARFAETRAEEEAVSEDIQSYFSRTRSLARVHLENGPEPDVLFWADQGAGQDVEIRYNLSTGLFERRSDGMVKSCPAEHLMQCEDDLQGMNSVYGSRFWELFMSLGDER
ncbi:hypothetical protein [Azospirillum himalayense]|uniref:Uncharacterized protein n=1 Tax=Azospirillum himalayense TaxID=654847 RepID=A0ABW0GEN6_9PROT